MMKNIKINTWKKGLLFKNGNYVKMLDEGSYWYWPWYAIIEYDMAKPIVPPVNLNILLKDASFVDATIVVEVKNNEIALQYENGLFVYVLTPGKYVFWKGLVNYEFMICNLNNIEMDQGIDRSLLSRNELLNYIRVFTVDAHELAVMYVDGKYRDIMKPGVYFYWKNNTNIIFSKADMRTIQVEVSGQEMLTKDKAALRINFYTQYQVIDIVKALVNNKEFDKQLYVLIQLALREYIGSLTLDELLEKKESVSEYIKEAITLRAENLGISIRESGIKDIILPGEMKEIMNQVLIAEKKAQANTILRREETASTRNLLNTAKLMEDNAMLFKLKEMEYVEKIADKINNISLSGGNQIIDQLKQIFVPAR